MISLIETPQPSEQYLKDPAVRKLTEFFDAKGLATLKHEDRREQWYDDWLAYQAQHRLYASLLSPRQLSTRGDELDLLRLTRFLEVFGYHSAAHGYSLQVSFLGLFSILMGSNEALKREAVAQLEAGGTFAFGVSEKAHGSDLLGNEFSVREAAPGHFVANGRKYYIGNANCASMISIVARRDEPHGDGRARRAPFILFALRPEQSRSLQNVRKIRTHGVRAAFVGEFRVVDHLFQQADVIAQGRDAWDAVLGTVTIGKFLLGFGSIGICEHAMREAVDHLRNRILYGRPALEMPHLRFMTAQACARLAAMKLYAYRALDYVQAASALDQRYLLYCAVQKAKVSIEGVKVMSLLTECIGAKAFESDTYFEMALRDARLIPGLEGSTHINLAYSAQFANRYLDDAAAEDLPSPRSLAGAERAGENSYLIQPHSAMAANRISFSRALDAFDPLAANLNVTLFAQQVGDLQHLLKSGRLKSDNVPGAPATQTTLAIGQLVSIVAYGQLIAENARILQTPTAIVTAIFHLLVEDLSAQALHVASLPQHHGLAPLLQADLVRVPRTSSQDWEDALIQLSQTADAGQAPA